jgi:hypothetical protein
MKKQICSGIVMVVLVVLPTSFGQQRRSFQASGGGILAQGTPPLTQRMVDRIEGLYEFLLEIRLSATQREQFQQGVVSYWTRNDREGMEGILGNLKYADLSADELRAFRDSNQSTIVENMRRDSDNPEELVLIAAYDAAHPDRHSATRAKVFNDLVGTWSRDDALLARRDPYSGAVTGVSYTDSGTIEIAANGSFKLVQQHTHCGSGCCRLDGEQEAGSVSIAGSMLVFEIRGGSTLVQDDCSHRNQRVAVAPHRESYKWSIRSNPNNNATMLCWNTSADKAVCYEKQ